MLLTETYRKRLALSESVLKKNLGNDAVLNEGVKQAIAQVLKNQSTYLDSKKDINEAYGANTVGTQMGNIGNFKRFALDLTTIALPNTIATELVITKAMPTQVGVIQYWRIIAGSNKSGIKQGDLFADVFKFGAYSEERMDYTSGNLQAELVALDAEGKGFLAWTPISTAYAPALVGAESGASIEVLDAETGEIKVTGATGSVKVKYVYDQIPVPQNDIPHLSAEVDKITLEAKPRRIAVYFSQMAAFVAKQEQGVDLGNMLRTQAVAELSSEIDTEVVSMLYNACSAEETVKFNKRVPVGISKFEHFEGFAETIEEANEIIYNRTRKFNANYMVCNRKVLNVLALLRGWKDSGAKKAGPYFAGTINGIKVFVHPILPEGEFFMGYNGDDLMTSAGVFAPYMTIVPTAELQFADGGTTQGWSTLYDCKILNDSLLVKGAIVDEADANANQVVSMKAVD